MAREAQSAAVDAAMELLVPTLTDWLAAGGNPDTLNRWMKARMSGISPAMAKSVNRSVDMISTYAHKTLASIDTRGTT